MLTRLGVAARTPSPSFLAQHPTLPILYVLFTTFILTGVSNAVNLTDGLDGLAAGLSAIAFGVLAIFAYLIGRVDASLPVDVRRAADGQPPDGLPFGPQGLPSHRGCTGAGPLGRHDPPAGWLLR